ncbi:hypothetical protein MG293_014825 [Ovis ammon polii]|uniref:Uncharacterized protein n=1 Tax=Ovis ammon polii TaxID=230172 RepID=A0AAD4Y5F5_OVIAM|nr:hypothetical protein MG293_014825 [Ovis ammon polii]
MAEDPSESRSGRLRILVESEASVLSQGNSRGIVRKCQGRGQATLLDRDAGILLDEEQRAREKLHGVAGRQRATQAPLQEWAEKSSP